MLPLEDCLGAAQECNAPMVSICGGEPLIYPHIEALVNGLLDQGRIVYVCTNAMFMRKKMREWMASEFRKPVGPTKELERKLDQLVSEGLVSQKEAEKIRDPNSKIPAVMIAPSTWLIKKGGKLEIISTPNQDSPLMDGNAPVLGVDVWEHAYYLHYQNRRPDYIKAWWNVVNWDEVAKNY